MDDSQEPASPVSNGAPPTPDEKSLFQVPCTIPHCLETFIQLKNQLAKYEKRFGSAAKEKGSLKAETMRCREQATRMEMQIAKKELELNAKENARLEAESTNQRLQTELDRYRSEENIRADLERQNSLLLSRLADSECFAGTLNSELLKEREKVHNLRLTNDRLTIGMNSHEQLEADADKITRKTFGIVENQVQDYVDRMQSFLRRMRSDMCKIEDQGKAMREDMSRFEDENSFVRGDVNMSFKRNVDFRARLHTERGAETDSPTLSPSNSGVGNQRDSRRNSSRTPSRYSNAEQRPASPPHHDMWRPGQHQTEQAGDVPLVLGPRTGRKSNLVYKRPLPASETGDDANEISKRTKLEEGEIDVPTEAGSVNRSRDPRLQTRSGSR